MISAFFAAEIQLNIETIKDIDIKMIKSNFNFFIAGTTTLLLGMTFASTHVQAASLGKCDKALTERITGTGNKKPDEEKSAIYKDETKIHDAQGNETTIGKVAKNQDKNNPLGIAGMFGAFASDHVDINHTDFNDNVATNELRNPNDFGTRGESHNNTKEDINYIGSMTSGEFASNTFRNRNGNHVVLDQLHGFDLSGDKAKIHNNTSNNLKSTDVIVEDPKLKYIDMDSEFEKLRKKSDAYFDQKESLGIEKDFNDRNNQVIKVTNAKPDKNNLVFVDVNIDKMNQSVPLKIDGIKDGKDAPTIIINVQGTEESVKVDTEIKLKYQDGSEANNAEDHKQFNHLLWNFGTNVKKLDFDAKVFYGSVLAPNADATIGPVNGNVVAKSIILGGQETHRWDLYVIDPGKPSGEPGDDKPGDDKPDKDHTPKDPNFPYEDDFVYPPKNETLNKPSVPENQTPTNSETPTDIPVFSQPQAKTPFPDEEENFYPALAKAHDKESFDERNHTQRTTRNSKITQNHEKKDTANDSNRVITTDHKQVITRIKTIANKLVKKGSKQNVLPQTGEKQNHLFLTGLALATASLILGLFSKKRKQD